MSEGVFISGVELNLSELMNGSKRGTALRKAIRISINAGASPVKARVVSNASENNRTGAHAKSIRIRVKLYGSGKPGVVIVGAKRGLQILRTIRTGNGRKKKKRKIVVRPARYTALLERDTKHKRGTKFLTNAFAATAPTYQGAVITRLRAELQKLLFASFSKKP